MNEASEYRKTNKSNVTNESIIGQIGKDRNELCCLGRLLLVTMYSEDGEDQNAIEVINETIGRESRAHGGARKRDRKVGDRQWLTVVL